MKNGLGLLLIFLVSCVQAPQGGPGLAHDVGVLSAPTGGSPQGPASPLGAPDDPSQPTTVANQAGPSERPTLPADSGPICGPDCCATDILTVPADESPAAKYCRERCEEEYGGKEALEEYCADPPPTYPQPMYQRPQQEVLTLEPPQRAIKAPIDEEPVWRDTTIREKLKEAEIRRREIPSDLMLRD